MRRGGSVYAVAVCGLLLIVCGAAHATTEEFATDVNGQNDCVALRAASTVYPPDTTSTADCAPGTALITACRHNVGGGTPYYVCNGLMQWDTSSIPDTATVTAAYVKLYGVVRDNADGLSLTAGYYSTWPITSAAYTEGVETDAIGGVSLASLGTGAYQQIDLTSLTGINLTGYTGLRFTISQRAEDATPTGANQFRWADRGYGGSTYALLGVTYLDATPTATAGTPTDTPTITPTPTVTPTATPTASPTCPYGTADYFAQNVSQEGIYSQPIGPEAVYANGKTYVAWQGTSFDPYVAVYDHTAHNWVGPYKAGTANLDTNDTHGGPALLVDHAGYLHLYFSAHDSALQHVKSTTPYDASSWGAQDQTAFAVSYPNIYETADHTFWLFFRAGAHLTDIEYRTSTDGVTWNTPVSILTSTAPSIAWYFSVIKGDDDSFHIGFVWKDEDNSLDNPGPEFIQRYNAYYVRRNANGTWSSIGGSTITLPISKTTADSTLMMYDSVTPDTNTNIPVLALNASGTPAVLFIAGTTNQNVVKYAVWGGTSWAITDIATTDHSFDAYALQWVTATHMRAYIVRNGTSGTHGNEDSDLRDRGGNIEQWDSTDSGDTWSLTATLLDAAVTGKIYNDPRMTSQCASQSTDCQASLQMVVAEWPAVTDFDGKVFAWGDNGFVKSWEWCGQTPIPTFSPWSCAR